jgi:FlaA1/EpsC-like NDP-sugar epimerase
MTSAVELSRADVRALRHLSPVARDLALVAQDVAALTLSILVMLVLRYDAAVPSGAWSSFWWFLPIPAALTLLVNRWWGLYGRVWRHASIYEARRVLGAGICATALLVVLSLATGHAIPISVAGTAGITYTMAIGGLRFHRRLFEQRPPHDTVSGLRVAVIGAGELGAMTVRAMLNEPRRSGLQPVIIIDDDPRMTGREMHGVPVAGPVDMLRELIAEVDVQLVVLAVRNPPAQLVRRAADAADVAGVPLRLAPEVTEILTRGVQFHDLRDISIEDLLGRREVQTDLEAVRRLLAGRRVLVTGAGGSIGSEIARQVAQFEPSELYLLDHDETHLHDVAATLPGAVSQVLADIRDAHVIDSVFARLRPEVVFHAAAHKHVPLLESHACEAVRTNVLGTAAVVRACEAAGVERFVFISTDKAVRPSSVMGASKRIAEHVVLSQRDPHAVYCGVRFGNVLGSRGSVIPTFLRELRAGGPVTVTDARMTRFFMSITEAVQLVLQAAALARGGELFMLEMGEPVRILDLAERMIRLSGQRPGADIEIRITGVRPGEKLTEELHTADEDLSPTQHPSIMQLVPQRVSRRLLDQSLAALDDLVAGDDEQQARATLMRLAWAPARIDLPADPPPVIELTERRTWNPSSI